MTKFNSFFVLSCRRVTCCISAQRVVMRSWMHRYFVRDSGSAALDNACELSFFASRNTMSCTGES